MWRQLHGDAVEAARCTVARLMRREGLHGVRRGKKHKTTRSDPATTRPSDLVDRDISAMRPNQTWLAALTYVRTWSDPTRI